MAVCRGLSGAGQGGEKRPASAAREGARRDDAHAPSRGRFHSGAQSYRMPCPWGWGCANTVGPKKAWLPGRCAPFGWQNDLGRQLACAAWSPHDETLFGQNEFAQARGLQAVAGAVVPDGDGFVALQQCLAVQRRRLAFRRMGAGVGRGAVRGSHGWRNDPC